jgi:hypothetical protein
MVGAMLHTCVCGPARRWFNALFLAAALVTMLALYGQYQASRYEPLELLPTSAQGYRKTRK